MRDDMSSVALGHRPFETGPLFSRQGFEFTHVLSFEPLQKELRFFLAHSIDPLVEALFHGHARHVTTVSREACAGPGSSGPNRSRLRRGEPTEYLVMRHYAPL